MDKLIIKPGIDKISSVSRTIRIKEEYFDTICEISEKTGVSFNKIINQFIAYSLKNLDDSNLK